MQRRPKGTVADTQLRGRAAPDGLPANVPLVHVTAVWRAHEIIKARQLETRPCRDLKQDLLYFFALKPAYGLKQGDEKSHQLNRFPFAFVVSADAVPNPHHVYPFDTGGALGGVFIGADPYIPLEDYELEPTHAAVMGHIGWAFGDVDAYFEGELRRDILKAVPRYETVTHGFVDIARMPATGSNRPDERASAIEVAASHNVRLKGFVRLAVIPRQYLEGEDGEDPNDDLIHRLEAEGVAIEPYNWQANTTPDAYRDEITRIIKAFYAKLADGQS